MTVKSEADHDDPTYPQSKDYDRLKRMLNATKPLLYKNSEYSGWLEVR